DALVSGEGDFVSACAGDRFAPLAGRDPEPQGGRMEGKRRFGGSRGRGGRMRLGVAGIAGLAAAVAVGIVFAASAGAVTISSFSPTSGLPNKDAGTACPGATVTITGSGFVNDGPTSQVQVMFNGLPAAPGSVQVGSDSTVYAIVPDGGTDG